MVGQQSTHTTLQLVCVDYYHVVSEDKYICNGYLWGHSCICLRRQAWWHAPKKGLSWCFQKASLSSNIIWFDWFFDAIHNRYFHLVGGRCWWVGLSLVGWHQCWFWLEILNCFLQRNIPSLGEEGMMHRCQRLGIREKRTITSIIRWQQWTKWHGLGGWSKKLLINLFWAMENVVIVWTMKQQWIWCANHHKKI